uniref:DNA topoisomerase (ATP-hydrolyzing) n=1 Tax=Proboscia inermis TaxID=420281 RepID=A0A7S0GB34_9STRA
MAEFNNWAGSLLDSSDDGSGEKAAGNGAVNLSEWNVKYYKGLGTSTSSEGKEYFTEFKNHFRTYRWDSENDDKIIDLVFDKDRSADRRDWIKAKYQPNVSVPVNDQKSIRYKDFFDYEMVCFSNSDNIRSIPSLMDGLKPSQRKVLYSCFKRNLTTNEMKVAQLAGYCAEQTAYHHGEASLHATITNMAQDFVGSNNINLLVPNGQFGTRLAGGKDSASPRYIFTQLAKVARLLFPEVDDDLLTHEENEGQKVEPTFFVPIIPLVLVNGCQGVGTGWSTLIPSYNAHQILDYIRFRLDNGYDNERKRPPIEPWVRGFNGKFVVQEGKRGYTTKGIIEKVSPKSFRITELPVGRWTNDYKSFLIRLQETDEIQSFVENHTTDTVSFHVTMKVAKLNSLNDVDKLHRKFRLTTNLNTTNMNLFDENGVIQKFDSAEAIADAYFPVRLALYYDRKVKLELSMEYKSAVLQNKSRFIGEVVSGKFSLLQETKPRAEILAMLNKLGYAKMSMLDLKKRQQQEGNITDDDDAVAVQMGNQSTNNEFVGADKNFDYLLNIPLASFSSERVTSLVNEANNLICDLDALKSKTPEDMWRNDLDKLNDFLKTM